MTVAVAALLGIGGTAAATTGGLWQVWSGGPGNPPTQIVQGSERATVSADKVQAYTASHANSGYGNMRIDAAAGSLTVFWKGPVPDALRTELATVASVPVTYRPARYTSEELTAAMTRLQDAQVQLHGDPGIDLRTVGLNEDASGITVGYTPVDAGSPNTPDLGQRLTDVAGVDVTSVGVASARLFADPRPHSSPEPPTPEGR